MALTVVACMHEIINCIHYWFSCLFACGGSISFMEYCHVGSNESGKAHTGLFYGHFHRTQVNLFIHIAVSLHYVSDYCKWPKDGVCSLGLLLLSFFVR